MSTSRSQKFIQTESLEDFFKKNYSKFYSNYDIAFVKNYLEFCTRETEQTNSTLEHFINNLDIRTDMLSELILNVRSIPRSG